MRSQFRTGAALVAVGMIVIASCGGSEQPSSRQRNSALATCSSATAIVEKGVELPNGGVAVGLTVQLCEAAAKFAVVGTDGGLTAVETDIAKKTGTFGTVAYADRSSDNTIRLYDANDAVIGDEVISLSVTKNDASCGDGGPCVNGDTGPSGGEVVRALGFPQVYEVDLNGGPNLVTFPTCVVPNGVDVQVATSEDAGSAKVNTEFMQAQCSMDTDGLLDSLRALRTARSMDDWYVPSFGDVRNIEQTLNTSLANVGTSTLRNPTSEISGIFASRPSEAGSSFITSGTQVALIPIRYLQDAPKFVVTASVAAVVQDATATTGNQSPDQPSDDAQTAPSEDTFPAPTNFRIYAKSGTPYLEVSLDYPDEDFSKVDEMYVGVYDGETLIADSSLAKGAWISEGESRRGLTVPPTDLLVDKEYTVRAFFHELLEVSGGSTIGKKSDTVTSNVVLKREVSTPTGLAMSEDEVLTWQPAHTDTNGYSFDPARYPYVYRINWRKAGTNDSFILEQAESPSFDFNEGQFSAGVEYEFTVEEVLIISGSVVTVSSASESLITIPTTQAELDKEMADRLAAKQAHRAAGEKCVKEAPQLALILRDPASRTVEASAPANSDDALLFSVMHPCINDTEARVSFMVEEFNKSTGRRMWRSIADYESSGPVTVNIPGDRLSAGSHTVAARVMWWDGDDPLLGDSLFSPVTEWTFEIESGQEPFPKRCQPEDISLDAVREEITINCENVRRLRLEDTTLPRRNIRISDDNRNIELRRVAAGWQRLDFRIDQEVYRRQNFALALCVTKCDAGQLDENFSLSVTGDTANLSLTRRSECPAPLFSAPIGIVGEYAKLSDGLYFSLDAVVGSWGFLTSLSPLTRTLKPDTAGFAAERRDDGPQCRARKWSFITLDRSAKSPPDLEDIVIPPFTEVLLEPEDVVSTNGPVIVVPATAQSLSVSSDVISALAPSGGTVAVAADGGEFETLSEIGDLYVSLPPTAKMLSIRVTDKNGRVAVLSKPIVRLEDTESTKVNEIIDKAGETVPKADPSIAGRVGDSGSSPIMYIVIAALVLLVLGGGATVVRKRKS